MKTSLMTMAAVRSFQEANKLAVGELTYETLEALGVTVKG
jgi:hypothetical protein